MTLENRKLVIAFTLLSACDPELENGDDSESLRHEDQYEDAVAIASELEVVYELRRVRDSDNNVVDTSEFGRLDRETWQKVARPSGHLDDEFIYIEEAGTNSTADGGVEQVYRVRRIPNVAPPVPEYEAPDPAEIINPKLAEVLAELDDAGVVRVMLKLPNYPDSNLPLLPEVSAVSVEDYLTAQADRDAAIEDRKARFERLSGDLVTAIHESGGEIVQGHWSIGWINADLSKAAILSLSRSGLVSTMHPDDMGLEAQGLRLGDLRDRINTDAKTFWDNGYYGEDPDTNSPILVGIQEEFGVDDNACFWDEDGGCTPSRLNHRWQCDSMACAWESSVTYDEDGVDVGHGTVVSSIIAADYTENQADGYNVCDGINTVHDMTFEGRASGYAPEAEVSYFDHLGTSSTSPHVLSTDCLRGIGGGNCVLVDVVNSSNGWTPTCDADSNTSLEDVAEDAFDDGLFLVYAAGNNGIGGSCNVAAPADTPKVFAVNGIDVSASAYAVAPIDSSGACNGLDCAVKGGGTVESPNGTTRVGALSMIGLAAPANGLLFTTTNSTDERGCVLTATPAVGTSVAAPAVAGMAALLKSFHLDVGDTWVSSPGRMFAMMLAMGDREDAGGGTNTNGADDLFGMGRAKLRLMDTGAPSMNPGGYWMTTHTVTNVGYVFNTFGGAVVPNGTEEVKCVSFAHEDMSGKDDISDIDLEVRLRGLNGSGVCAEGEGTLYSTRTDTSYDNKKMVAFEDAGTNVEGRCVEITLDRAYVSSAGSVTVNTFCMYTSEVDTEPN